AYYRGRAAIRPAVAWGGAAGPRSGWRRATRRWMDDRAEDLPEALAERVTARGPHAGIRQPSKEGVSTAPGRLAARRRRWVVVRSGREGKLIREEIKREDRATDIILAGAIVLVGLLARCGP